MKPKKEEEATDGERGNLKAWQGYEHDYGKLHIFIKNIIMNLFFYAVDIEY